MNYHHAIRLLIICSFCFSGFALAQNKAGSFWNSEQTFNRTNTDDSFLASITAGPIRHIVDHIEALVVIPAERAREDRRRYARELKLESGNYWLVVEGRSINEGWDKRILKSTTFDLVDSQENIYRRSWSTSVYVPEVLKLRSTELAPGQVSPWILFFEVPETASGLMLRADNLPSVEKDFAYFDFDSSLDNAFQNIGAVHYRLTALDKIDELPEDWTVEGYANNKKPQPAKDGHKWYVLSGHTENRGTDARKISSRDFTMIDNSGNEYRNETLFRFENESTRVRSGKLAAGELKNWKLFYQIPTEASGVKLRVSNLRWIDLQKVSLALPSPAELMSNRDNLSSANTSVLENVTDNEFVNAANDDIDAYTIPQTDLSALGTVTGEVTHRLMYAEVTPVIPASRVIKQWEDRGLSNDLSAPKNTVWVHIVGKSKNRSSEIRSLKANFVLLDSQNREFAANTSDTQYYVEDSRSILSNEIPPGAEVEWDSWFLIFNDAKNLRIKLDDLTFLGNYSEELSLPIDNETIANRGGRL